VSCKRRIAILGGGVGGMAAAFDLTDTQERRAQLEVTVYQMGWRLGGKGASGRNLERNDRIEEHGVHIWGGYYHNAFALMRRCYAALGRPATCPLARIEDAFRPRRGFNLQEGAQRWDIDLPVAASMPGDGRMRRSAAEQLQLAIGGMRILARELRGALRSETARRRARIVTDYVWTHLRGLVADRVLQRGLEVLDDEDWSQWLRRHGAREETLRSPLVTGIYDMMFAYLEGDTDRPALSAGRVLHTYRRFALGYRGALFWEMQGGMGDVVFAPLYEVLRARGVQFRFFHRADALHPGRDGIERIELTRQAVLRHDDYDPLVKIRGVPSWPARPRWEQLDGDERVDFEDPAVDPQRAEPRTLRRGVDFDDVVLAVGRGAVPKLCRALVERDPRWARALQATPTVTTHALQLWTRRSAKQMGSDGARNLASGGAAPLAVRADMTHVEPRESWPPGDRPRHVAYFCGVVDRRDASFCAETWVAMHLPDFFPDAGKPGHELVMDTFYERNAHPSDLYVLTPPGSVRHRLAADESGLDNLWLAGDWLRTSYSLGTVESACIAGRSAAQAILGEPLDIVGEAR